MFPTFSFVSWPFYGYPTHFHTHPPAMAGCSWDTKPHSSGLRTNFPQSVRIPIYWYVLDVGYYLPLLSNNENFGIISSVLMWDSACSCIESLSQINFAPSACPSRDKDQQSLWDLRSPICVWQVQYPSRKWPNPWQFSRRPETWVCHHFQWP